MMRHAWMVIALAWLWLFPGLAAAQDKPIELKFSSWVGIAHGHHTGVMVWMIVPARTPPAYAYS